MSDRPIIVNQLSFKRKFVAALIDGVILNTGLGVILAVVSNIASDIALLNANVGNFDLVFSLVYFATLDSIPKQLRLGRRLVESTFTK
ncbi:hypothetical protein [Aliterella atlantica]|uniref:RDD domain-containing protein n=1 Tax=Aliterella atlantica CENA595 TaxID=1618023 RepID=A0A0D8ZXP8_9CYAN|nr:hypothetical protein [Aliterella atlantica]KJH71991.1 hypothetical protein UH38_09835 [Aliterella atlantica CENA595]